MDNGKSPQTIAAANGIGSDAQYGAVTPPIHLSTTYRFPGFEKPGPYDYSRTANPTRDLLADTLAQLEGGAGAVVTATGMAAVSLLLATLDPGDLVVAPHDCYGGTHRLLSMRAAKGHFDVAFVNLNEAAGFAEALRHGPALILIETPSNPLMRITDIAKLAEQGKAAGAKIAVDNTFLSPALQQPLALGADFVIHSTTKYLNGHSDVVGGAVIAADTRDLNHLKDWANAMGLTGSPFDAYLTLRGLRTLFPRMEHQQRTAFAMADFLDRHPCVETVHYPGLPSHPGHAIAERQQRGYGAMLSFNIKGGADGARRFVEAVKVFTLAESLGGIESLVAHPATMTHASMGIEARRAAGIDDSLLRLSIGLEGERDLLMDLDHALRTVAPLLGRNSV